MLESLLNLLQIILIIGEISIVAFIFSLSVLLGLHCAVTIIDNLEYYWWKKRQEKEKKG